MSIKSSEIAQLSLSRSRRKYFIDRDIIATIRNFLLKIIYIYIYTFRKILNFKHHFILLHFFSLLDISKNSLQFPSFISIYLRLLLRS